VAGRRFGWVVAGVLSIVLVFGSLPQDVVFAAAAPTTTITLSGNLDSRALAGATATRNVTIYDSNGAGHIAQFAFTRVPGANAWDWQTTTSDAAIVAFNPLATGTVTFDSAGVAQVASPQATLALSYANGASDQSVDVIMSALTGRAQGSSLASTVNGSAATTGGGSAAATVDGTKRVTIFGRRFTPTTIKVPLGTTLIFRNGDRVKHTVTGNTFRSRFGELLDIGPAPLPGAPEKPIPRAPGNMVIESPVLDSRPEPAYPGAPRPPELDSSLFEFTPPREGSYSFRCTIHKGMGGTIVVGTAGGPPTGGDPTPVPPPPVATPVRGARVPVVTIFGNRFRPEKLQVVEGTTVTFRNGDRGPHTISGANFRDSSGVLTDWEPARDPTNPLPPSGLPAFSNSFSGRPTPIPGNNQSREEEAPYQYSFDQPGTYNYRGERGTMRGTIVVVTPTPSP
jgi:plastocyanin